MTRIDTTDEISEGLICIVPDCDKPAKWKGLCPTCYGAAKKFIDAGETTWDQLVDMGLAIDRTAKFRAAFNAKMEALEKSSSGVSPDPNVVYGPAS